MKLEEQAKKLGYFYCKNAAGHPTCLKPDEVSAIVYIEDRDLVLVTMRNGKEFGFNGADIRYIFAEEMLGRDMFKDVEDTALEALILIRGEVEHPRNLNRDLI